MERGLDHVISPLEDSQMRVCRAAGPCQKMNEMNEDGHVIKLVVGNAFVSVEDIISPQRGCTVNPERLPALSDSLLIISGLLLFGGNQCRFEDGDRPKG